MKTKIFIIAILATSIGIFSSCKSGEKKEKDKETKSVMADSSRESLDWSGTYTGTVPCADCQGIHMVITLNKNLTYKMSMKYLGKSEEYMESGDTFSWNEAGNIITLDDKENHEGMNMFQVGENKLTMLDINGNIISGENSDLYILKKVKEDIVEKYWKLKELNGKEISWSGQVGREPHIILKVADNSVIGSGGCNGIRGTYKLDGDKVEFSKFISTMMACPDLQLEGEFVKIFDAKYTYKVEGDNLMLYNEDNQPVAKFEVVYL